MKKENRDYGINNKNRGDHFQITFGLLWGNSAVAFMSLLGHFEVTFSLLGLTLGSPRA